MTYCEIDVENRPIPLSQPEFVKAVGSHPVVMVHGFRESQKDSVHHFRDVAEKYTWTEKVPSAVIAFTWPSGIKGLAIASILSFRNALKRTEQAGRYLGSLLSLLPPETCVYAHSLGCKVTLHAVADRKKILYYAILAGAACSPKLLDDNYQYFGQVAVTHSREDDVLRWLYRVVVWQQALGFVGVNYMAPNIKQYEFDCDHSDYHDAPQMIPLLR